MTRFSKLAVALAAVPVFAFAGSAMADSPGQLTGGSNVLVAKNITQKGSYASSISASCNEEVQYSAQLHNAGSGGLTNVIVTASLANGTVTAVPAEGATFGTNGSVSVSIPAGASLAYENGSATLFDGSGNVIKTLPDTVTSSGVNVGTIKGSTFEYVVFKAKVSCPTTPTPTPTPTPTTPKTTTLPNTGAGDVVGIFTGVSAAGTAAHAIVSRRKRGL